MTSEQKLKYLILVAAARMMGESAPKYPCEDIDELYENASRDYVYDARSEVREGEVETGLDSPSSRYYETKEVAAQLPDGSWVGWTYWYGGGKHGNPESIEWMDGVYDLDCAEEEKLVKVRTFSPRPVEVE
jgi:hypothetical protein